MESVYLFSLIVGGFFVLLSALGGGDSDTDVDAGLDADADLDAGADIGAGAGFVDLLSLRALFLFMAFFGLTGSLLTWTGEGDPITTPVIAGLTGLVIALGGNYVIKRVAYDKVDSRVTRADLKGRTAKVIVPFEAGQRGKISLVSKGSRIQMLAAPFDDETAERYQPGDEVVVVSMKGSTAQVVKPT